MNEFFQTKTAMILMTLIAYFILRKIIGYDAPHAGSPTSKGNNFIGPCGCEYRSLPRNKDGCYYSKLVKRCVSCQETEDSIRATQRFYGN